MADNQNRSRLDNFLANCYGIAAGKLEFVTLKDGRLIQASEEQIKSYKSMFNG